MEQWLSREADSCSAGQIIPCLFCLLWMPKIHYCALKRSQLDPILNHMNPGHTITHDSLRSILILSSHLCWVYKMVSSLQVVDIVHQFLLSPSDVCTQKPLCFHFVHTASSLHTHATLTFCLRSKSFGNRYKVLPIHFPGGLKDEQGPRVQKMHFSAFMFLKITHCNLVFEYHYLKEYVM